MWMPGGAWRRSLVETGLIAGFAFLVGWVAASSLRPQHQRPIWFIDPEWEARLSARFGTERFSAGLEEYLVRDFLKDQRDGVFVDVGAFHPVQGSNTYRLERDLGWSGLAIDADASLAESYRARPRTRFTAAFVAAKDAGTAQFFKGAAGASSGVPEFTEQFGPVSSVVEVPVRTLDSLLLEHGIHRIDFLSMDIELGEPSALLGFDITRHRPRLVCVEAHQPTRQWLLNYFARHGYVLIGDYLPADQLNVWFRPLAPDEPGAPPALEMSEGPDPVRR